MGGRDVLTISGRDEALRFLCLPALLCFKENPFFLITEVA